MAINTISDGKQIKVVCNENLPELTNAKNFLYNNLKNKGYCETMGITEYTPLSRMVNLLNSFIPYAEPYLYLYNTGYMNSFITGSAEFEKKYGTNSGYFSESYDEDYITIKGTSSATVTYFFQNILPTSQFQTLKLDYKMTQASGNSYAYLYLFISPIKSYSNRVKRLTIPVSVTSGNIITSIDLSDINYDCYVGIFGETSRYSYTFLINKMWLQNDEEINEQEE